MKDYEFSDKNEKSVLTPEKITENLKDFSFSRYVILGFFPFLYSYIKNYFPGSSSAYINKLFPYYSFEFEKQLFTFQFPGIGAPLAGALLEESIALGGEVFVFIGMSGILKENIPPNGLIVPTSALIDEGTSWHYTKDHKCSFPDNQLADLIVRNLNSWGYYVCPGRVWTTDGVYRETPSQIKRALENDCIAVDMEASALFTIAKFHKKKIAGLFVPSDFLGEKKWKKFKPGIHQIKPVKLLHLALHIMKQCKNL